MEDIKRRFTDVVAAKLSAAPPSTAKVELVEELSDNLYRRFLDMTGAGVPEDAAFRRAMDDLGDVDELLSYLGAEPRMIQTRTTSSSGKTVITNYAGAQSQDASQSRADGPGGIHYDRQPPQSDLDAILAGVSDACNTAIDQAKIALKQAKEAIQRRTTVQRDSGHVRVHFNSCPNDPAPSDPPTPPEPSADAQPSDGHGWEFEAELNTDEGKFFAGGGPRERKDVIYGFGYDKTRGGFFTQWGEHQDSSGAARGPHFCGEDGSHMEHQDDGSYSVTALRDLRGIEVFTAAGDVTVHVSEASDAGVIIDGDVDELDVTCSADGVLTIREGRTASSSFFSRRGFCSADVELFLPRRHWETLSISTASGDVDIDREGLDVDQLSVKTASGDLNVRLRACGRLCFKSASGDLDLEGSCANLQAETMSGDISLRGQLENAVLNSASGDIELEGLVNRFHGGAMSGDVSVETSQLPQVMEMSSKSGDCTARLPDAGPFTLRFKTVTGEADFAFPFQYDGQTAIYGDGSGPAYSMTTVSGDVSVKRH